MRRTSTLYWLRSFPDNQIKILITKKKGNRGSGVYLMCLDAVSGTGKQLAVMIAMVPDVVIRLVCGSGKTQPDNKRNAEQGQARPGESFCNHIHLLVHYLPLNEN
jgi:hypothetical protein